MGAATISSDDVVHDLLDGEDARARLVERWGEDVAPGGRVDRGRIAEIVFDRPDELTWLESLLHPLVGEAIARWRAGPAGAADVAVVEVPLLFETGMEGAFDAIVSIVADDSVREPRALARGHSGLEGRTGRQLSQDEKARRATYVVENNGTLEELEARLSELWPKLQDASADPSG
jgi:dephospho-CoA kinase